MKKIMWVVPIVFTISACYLLREKGSISGKVTNGGNPVSGAIVLALTKDSLIANESIDYTKLRGALTGSDGNYKIPLVDPGTYYVAAIKDVNSNLLYDPSIDLIGWYGTRDTISGRVVIPKLVTVESGEETQNINIDTLYTLPGK